jgi:hypothetical protein
MQALGERGSLFTSVRDEDARVVRRWHWTDVLSLSSHTSHRQENCAVIPVTQSGAPRCLERKSHGASARP